MLCFKAIQSSFTPNNPALFHRNKCPTRNKPNLVPCKSNSSDSEAPQPEGDKQKQELLARIAMLQAQKLRVIDYLDERSAFLTQFAEEANAEIDQIGENALKELDEAGSRIMENIESQMQAFEESAELSKLALVGLVVIGISDALITSSDWRKVAVLGAILVGLISQLLCCGFLTWDQPGNNCIYVVQQMKPEFGILISSGYPTNKSVLSISEVRLCM